MDLNDRIGRAGHALSTRFLRISAAFVMVAVRGPFSRSSGGRSAPATHDTGRQISDALSRAQEGNGELPRQTLVFIYFGINALITQSRRNPGSHMMARTMLSRSSQLSASGLVVKFNVAIVEPRVRFSAGACNIFSAILLHPEGTTTRLCLYFG